LGRQVGETAVERPDRPQVGRRVLVRQLVDPLRPDEVLQAVLALVDQ